MVARSTYHHGSLKTALVDAALALLEAEGLAKLSLRKCAEKVGVSHTAVQNHFDNFNHLLTALAAKGYETLADAMTLPEADKSTREERRSHTLTGYLEFALEHPALYELMFSRDRIHSDDPELLAEVRKCFVILTDVAEDLGWFLPDNDPTNAKSQVAIWSLAHGYAHLFIANRFKKDAMKGLTLNDLLPERGGAGDR